MPMPDGTPDAGDQIFGAMAPGYSPWGAAGVMGLGALASMANMGAQRLPYTGAQVLGTMAAGGMNALNSQRAAALQAQQLQAGDITLQMQRARMGSLAALLAKQQGGSAIGNAMPAASPVRVADSSGTAVGGAPSGGPLPVAPAISPSGTAAIASQQASALAIPSGSGGGPLPYPNLSPVENALLADMMIPGSGKGIMDHFYPGPTEAQRALASANISPNSPQGQQLLALSAAKTAGVTSGYQIGPNGQETPIAGGNADPRVLGAQKSAEAMGQAGADLWLAQRKPTDVQRELAAANISPSSPMGHALLSLAASKDSGVTSGYQIGPNGQESAVPGGNADPAVLERNAAAQGWGKAGPDAWTAAMAPKTVRGPGSAVINPYTNTVTQIPNEINVVDPATLATRRAFVPLGTQTTPLMPGAPTGAAGAPQVGAPTGSPMGTAPPSGPASPGPSGASAGGANSETSFLTGAPPGQEAIIKGAAENYTTEGRKAYESAADLKGSIAYIKRDLDTLGPQGFVSMGSGADLRGAFARALNTAIQAGGGQPEFDPNKVGAWEDFEKESTLGGMKGLATIFGGSREAATIVKTSMGAFPHPTNSYDGARLLVNAFDEAANREIDQRNFETNWIATHGGNLTGALEQFNTQYPAASYSKRAISTVQPVRAKSPDDLKGLLPGTQFIGPSGIVKMVPGNPGVALASPNG